MSKGEFEAWRRELAKSDSSHQFMYDHKNMVTGVLKRVDASLLPVYEALQQIDSAVLPHILEIREESDSILVTEEYIDGRSIRFLLDEEGAQNDAFVIKAAQDICEALIILHGKIPPIIHRDIKPENVILRKGGGFVLIDFDAARSYSETSRTDTVNLGTHGYAAPEQYGFMQSDARSDIYSLGAMLYELRAGRKFSAGAVCEGKLSSIIQKCTEFEPKNRYQTATELSKALRDSVHGYSKKQKYFMRFGIGTAAVIVAGLALVLPREPAPLQPPPSPSPTSPVPLLTPQAAAMNVPDVEDEPAEKDLPTPQANTPNVIAAETGQAGKTLCTCILADASDPTVPVSYSPDPMGAIGLLSGESHTMTLAVDTPRIEDNCEADEHDEPEYTYSFVGYVPPSGQDALSRTVKDDIVQGNEITIAAPGRYKVRYHTVYHDMGYGSDYEIEAYSVTDDALKGRSKNSLHDKAGARIPCTCILEDPLGPKSKTHFMPDKVDLPRGQTLVETLEVPPAIIYDCKAMVHDKPIFTYEFHQYIPPKGQESLADKVGPNIVKGNQISINVPGKYYVWFDTQFHGRRYRAGYSFWVYDAPASS